MDATGLTAVALLFLKELIPMSGLHLAPWQIYACYFVIFVLLACSVFSSKFGKIYKWIISSGIFVVLIFIARSAYIPDKIIILMDEYNVGSNTNPLRLKIGDKVPNLKIMNGNHITLRGVEVTLIMDGVNDGRNYDRKLGNLNPSSEIGETETVYWNVSIDKHIKGISDGRIRFRSQDHDEIVRKFKVSFEN